VADIEIRPVELRLRERASQCAGVVAVAVIADHQLVLVGELADALGVCGVDLARDRARAERFARLKQ
jgi:hypothetical protein